MNREKRNVDTGSFTDGEPQTNNTINARALMEVPDQETGNSWSHSVLLSPLSPASLHHPGSVYTGSLHHPGSACTVIRQSLVLVVGTQLCEHMLQTINGSQLSPSSFSASSYPKDYF